MTPRFPAPARAIQLSGISQGNAKEQKRERGMTGFLFIPPDFAFSFFGVSLQEN